MGGGGMSGLMDMMGAGMGGGGGGGGGGAEGMGGLMSMLMGGAGGKEGLGLGGGADGPDPKQMLKMAKKMTKVRIYVYLVVVRGESSLPALRIEGGDQSRFAYRVFDSSLACGAAGRFQAGWGYKRT